ncbi:LCP family protein [bacterium]|nr:LCP family protein [bacterium]
MNNNLNNPQKVYKVDYNRTFLNQDIYNDNSNDVPISKRRIILISIAICCVVFFGLLMIFNTEGFFSAIFGEDSQAKITFSKLFSNTEKTQLPSAFGLPRQNVLILGVDDNPDVKDLWTGTRTDTIIIVNIDPKTKSLNAVSVPRDSKVFLANNKGINKINSAHVIGGIDLTKKTVEKTLGIRIHRFVLVHENIVKDLVNALGGVDIYIEKPMQYRDRTAKLNINFAPGMHKLNGQEAVEYLRFRHDKMGDIGRTQRQQWFLRGVVKKLQEPSTISKIPELISIANQYIKTDIPPSEMLQYADFMRHLDLSKTEIATLPGQPNQKGYISYWILDPEKTQEVVNRLLYRDRPRNTTPEKQIVANIMFTKNKKSMADKLLKEFKAENIEVKCFEPINRIHSQFVAHSNRISNEYYHSLSSKLNNLPSYQFVYDPINLYCPNTEFTVILADD